MVNSQLVQILGLMRAGHQLFRQSIEDEAKPKGMFAVFKGKPDLIMMAGMVEGYEAALALMELRRDEASAAETLVGSVESLEASARKSTTPIAESAQLGMSKGAVWALGDFHRAMKVVHGRDYVLSNGYEKLISETLRRHGLQKLI
jgi:hypothetical protein